MARVLLTHELPGEAVERLSRTHSVTTLTQDQREELTLAREIGDYDALITLLSDPVRRDVFEAGKSLRIVANYAVGYNNIDIDAAREAGVWVTNTPDVLTDATADLTLALILACARRVLEGDAMVRGGAFTGWKPDLLLGMELKGKRLGILGMGRIGRAVAMRAQAFGLKIFYHDRESLSASVCPGLDAKYLSFEEIITTSDILSIHLPLTGETRHLLDAVTLQKLPKRSILINTARGPIVDEKALAEVLRNGHLMSAGLDVYEEEPKVDPELLALPSVVLLPHLGSATERTRSAMAELTVRNVERVLSGLDPETPVFRLQS